MWVLSHIPGSFPDCFEEGPKGFQGAAGKSPGKGAEMDWATILVAVITAGFAFLGVYMSNRKQAALVAYRL